MSIYRLRHRPRRPLAKLTLCLACATLASCELPHAIAADQPFVPVIPPSTRPPVVVVLTAPIPLPRWVEAAAKASPMPHFRLSDTAVAVAAPVEPLSPSTATPIVSAIDPPRADAVAPPPPRPAAATTAVRDPVIQIATPAYFDRPAPTLPVATIPAAPAARVASSTPDPTVAVKPAIPQPESNRPITADASPPAAVPASTASSAPLPGLPATPVTITTTTITTSELPPQSEPQPAATAVIAPIPGTPVTPVANVETAVVNPVAPAATPALSNTLEVTGGRFAGMPLPNLPVLAPEPDAAATGAAAPALQTARNDEALAPRSAPVSQADETAAAQAELRRASERTGLSALQLARIEESRRLIAEDNASLALDLTRTLNAELDAASTRYTVKGTENLWQIAELPQVYGNAYLWPLIWRANAQLRQPTDLKPGMSLRIPSNPGVLQVTEAIDYARRAGGEKMQPVPDTSTGASAP